MLVNADFSRRAMVTPAQYDWVASPQSGVERVMLDRLGGEQARATSIVRYAPDSFFPHHQHPGGEEVLVLSGTFSTGDEHYPAGWYLRNPPGSSHQPYSREGAILFVKLWQMRPDERQGLCIDTRDPSSWRRQGGGEICHLFSSHAEQVCLQGLAPGEALFTAPVDSAELLVLDGTVRIDDQSCEPWTWLRLPKGEYPDIVAGEQGASVYLKTGHLTNMAAEA